MTSFSIGTFVLLLFCSSMIFTPISAEVNIYFLNDFSNQLGVSNEMLFFVLLGSTIGVFICMFGEWRRIIVSLFVSGSDAGKHRTNSLSQMWLILWVFIFTLFFGFITRGLFEKIVPDAFYSLALLIGLLINIFLVRVIVKLGNERKKEYYQLRFLSFIVLGFVAGFGFLPGIALILPMILIFRAFGVSVYQSLKFTLMVFTLIAVIALTFGGQFVEFTGYWQLSAFAVVISAIVTFIIIRWFAIFTADDIKVLNIFKNLAWVQVFILVIWFL